MNTTRCSLDPKMSARNMGSPFLPRDLAQCLNKCNNYFFFSNIDRRDSGLLTQQQFRAAIEGRFELNMSDQEFDQFLKKVPIDSDGMVKYVEFMSKFDTL